MDDQQNPILDPPWKELVKIASAWKYGTHHSHEEIAGVMRVSYPSSAYYQNVISANKELTIMGKRLVNFRKDGYYVLKPGEQNVEVVHDISASIRKFRSGLGNWHSAATTEMTDTEKEIHEHLGVSATRVFASLSNGYSEAAQIVGIDRKQKMLESASKGKE